MTSTIKCVDPNEHVVPRHLCQKSGCPGFKVIRDFGPQGENQKLTDFIVVAHDNSEDLYDFTLLKFNLPDGQKVPYLGIETDMSLYSFDENTSVTSFKALGHPGGASLKFTAMKPIRQIEGDIILQGLVMRGNSGGPLVDVTTQKVIGIMKSTRTAPVVESDISATLETLSQATAISTILSAFEERLGVPVVSNEKIKVSELLKAQSEANNDFSPPDYFSEPSIDIFSGALRRSLATPRFMEAFEHFGLYFGTEREEAVLDLMLVQNDFISSPLDIDAINKVLSYSLAAGRPLKFSDSAKVKIEETLMLSDEPSELLSFKMTANIALNYFDSTKRKQLQASCLSAVPDFVQAYGMAAFICLSTKLSDGRNILKSFITSTINAENVSDDILSQVGGLLMFVSLVGTSESEDIIALQELDAFLLEKQRDLEMLFINDSYINNILTDTVGIGAFSNTFE